MENDFDLPPEIAADLLVILDAADKPQTWAVMMNEAIDIDGNLLKQVASEIADVMVYWFSNKWFIL